MLHLPPPRRLPTISIGLVSTYPPTRCGIGKFAASLVAAMRAAAPHVAIEVVRIVNGDEPAPTPDTVAMEFDPDCAVGVEAAARRLNRSDAVIIQHEYGIFGNNDGESILDLVAALKRPTLTVLHTVVADPTRHQQHIIETLGATGDVVVPSQAANDLLVGGYGLNRNGITVIPHGSDWGSLPVRPVPRHRILSWGLLGPGKGLERAIRAIALLSETVPGIHYRIVGQTHPKVQQTGGQQYRRQLEALVMELGVGHCVEFVDRYVDEPELYGMVAESDVVVTPYDNADQVSSGVLTEAIAAGRPVVATRFPHAVETLATGGGFVVDHRAEAVANGLRWLLTQPDVYEEAARSARAMSRNLSWHRVAGSYAELVDRMLSSLRQNTA